MDWDTARKYSIVFLIILNVAILCIRTAYSSQYNLTAEKRSSIIYLLEKRDIQLSADLPNRFAPMQSYTIKINTPDINLYRDIFFNNTDTIRRSVEFNKTILRDNTGSLEIENGKIHYNSYLPTTSFLNFEKSTAIDYTNIYYSRIRRMFSNLTLYNCLPSKDGSSFVVTYYDVIKGYPFFDSYATFVVSENGLVSADIQAASSLNSSNVEKEICSPDEAILSLLQKNIIEDTSISEIYSIYLGYSSEELIGDISDNFKVVPFYHIATDNGEFSVNAYSNIN